MEQLDPIAVAALLLSVLSLGWQAWTWRQSGAVLTVAVSNAITDAGNMLGTPEHYVCVRAINQGRQALTVSTWGIKLPDGRNFFVTQPPSISARTPARVEPGDSADFYVAASELRKYKAATGVSFAAMKPWVDTASGKRVVSRRPIPLK